MANPCDRAAAFVVSNGGSTQCGAAASKPISKIDEPVGSVHIETAYIDAISDDDLSRRLKHVRNQHSVLAAEFIRLREQLDRLRADRERIGVELANPVKRSFQIGGQIAARGELRKSQAEIRQRLRSVKIDIMKHQRLLADLGQKAAA